MTERAVRFGAQGSLVGIVTEPDPARSAPEGPGAILLNAGLLHRVGPNRLHVKIARRLADSGIVTMRFDFAGLGDSAPREDGSSFEKHSIADAREAFDYLYKTRGIERFFLIGICSGADIALQASYRDPRVVGAVLINGSEFRDLSTPSSATAVDREDVEELLAYAGARTQMRYYLTRLLSRKSWVRLIRGQSKLRTINKTLAAMMRDRWVRRTPRAAARGAAGDLGRLMDRGVNLLVVYSDGSPALDLFRLTVGRTLDRRKAGGRIRVEIVRRTDHVFTMLWAQERLAEMIQGWSIVQAGLKSPSPSPSPRRGPRSSPS